MGMMHNMSLSNHEQYDVLRLLRKIATSDC